MSAATTGDTGRGAIPSAEFGGLIDYRTRAQHFYLSWRHWRAGTTVGLATVGTGYGLVTLFREELGVIPNGSGVFIGLALLSVVAGMSAAAWAHFHAVPRGLEGESRRAKAIAQWRRPLWQYSLARQLMAERVGGLHRELTQLTDGTTFVACSRVMGVAEFHEWTQRHLENAWRLLSTSQALLMRDLPQAMRSTRERLAEPRNIVEAVDRVARLYSEIVAFERDHLSVVPPHGFENCHRLQTDWSEPIRDGFAQFLNYLDTVCATDMRRPQPINATVKLKPLPNVDEYLSEMASKGRDYLG